MAWTYDITKLATDTMTQIRLEIGDTDSTDQLLQDEEINFAISKENGNIGAAARCCEFISRKMARLAQISVGSEKVLAEQRYEHYVAEALRLRKNSIGLNAPTAGGIYESDTNTDSDLKPLVFGKDMMNADYTEE